MTRFLHTHTKPITHVHTYKYVGVFTTILFCDRMYSLPNIQLCGGDRAISTVHSRRKDVLNNAPSKTGAHGFNFLYFADIYHLLLLANGIGFLYYCDYV